MKNCGCLNVRKQRDTKNGDQYIDLKTPLKFVNMDKMKIISSKLKYYLGISGKGLITSLGLNTIRRSKNDKKAMFPLLKLVLKIFLRLSRSSRM